MVLSGANDGAYYPRSWLWTGLGLAALAGLHLLLASPGRLSGPELVSLSALAALLAWMLLSAFWGIPGTEAVREAARAGVYLAALVAFLAVVRRETARDFLEGVLAGIVALVAYGLLDRVSSDRAPDPFQGSLLVEPVGYANALGILAAIGLLLALTLLVAGRHPLGRAFHLGAACILGVGLALTSSRGAWMSTAFGITLLVFLHVRRRRLFTWGRALALASVVAFLLGLWAAVSAPLPTLGDRASYWRVALEDAGRHPLLGSGAGSFDDVWLSQRPIAASVRDAHSLYLEVLAELGPVGLALLLAMLAAPLVSAARARGAPVVAAATAGYSAYLVHAGLDWDWEYPVVTLAGLACGACLLTSAFRSAGRRAPPARGGARPARGAARA